MKNCYALHTLRNLLNVRVTLAFLFEFACLLCGCETCSVTIRKERSPRVIRNTILWKVSGAKREDVLDVMKVVLYYMYFLCVSVLVESTERYDVSEAGMFKNHVCC